MGITKSNPHDKSDAAVPPELRISSNVSPIAASGEPSDRLCPVMPWAVPIAVIQEPLSLFRNRVKQMVETSHTYVSRPARPNQSAILAIRPMSPRLCLD